MAGPATTHSALCDHAGILMIQRTTKKGQSRPWVYRLQDCTVMLGQKVSRQLALQSIDGPLYMRASSPEEREEWVKAITTSTYSFNSLVRRTRMHDSRSRLSEDEEVHAASKRVLDRKVRFLTCVRHAVDKGRHVWTVLCVVQMCESLFIAAIVLHCTCRIFLHADDRQLSLCSPVQVASSI